MTITHIQYRWLVLPTSFSESPIKCKNSVNVCLCACANPVGDSVDTNTLLLISPITGVSRQLLYLCCHSSSRALWASQWGYEERIKSCSSGKHTEIGTLEWACLSLSRRSTGLYITPGTGTSEQKLTCRPKLHGNSTGRVSSTSWPENSVGHTWRKVVKFLLFWHFGEGTEYIVWSVIFPPQTKPLHD